MPGDILGFFGNIGWQEILVILLVVLLLFGGRKLPELARGLGRGLREFRNELKGVKKEIEEEPEPDQAEKEEKAQAKQPRGKDTSGKSDDNGATAG